MKQQENDDVGRVEKAWIEREEREATEIEGRKKRKTEKKLGSAMEEIKMNMQKMKNRTREERLAKENTTEMEKK